MIALDRRLPSPPVVLPARRLRERPLPRRRVRRSPMAAAMVVAALAIAPALGYVWQQTEAAKTGYTILRLQRELTALQREHARLHATVSTLRSPQRIERIATSELGMVPPRQRQLAAITIPPAIAAAPQPPAARSWQERVAGWLGWGEAQAHERRR